MENKEYLQQLAEKWKQGTISPEEQIEFNQWYDSFDDSMLEDTGARESVTALKERIYTRILETENIDPQDTSLAQEHQTIPLKPSAKPVSFWISVAAAAAIFVAIGTALIFAPPLKNKSNATFTKNIGKDLKPGGLKATLTLADGRTVSLDEIKAGTLPEQSGISIKKSKEGVLVYQVQDRKQSTVHPSGFHTVSTPIGGTYQIELPDGTKVWLNAASSIRFPASFEGLKERKVDLNGEAYFEVAKNKDKPFRVAGQQQEIEVLGTHFNINAYPNEQIIKTTLLEGSVLMRYGKGPAAKLKPGQQGTFNQGKWDIKAVNAEEVIAWQKGNFVFNEQSLSSILRELERWYGVKVDYSQVPDRNFSGVISKDVYLSKVLKMLSLTGNIQLSLEGSSIKISK
ncbi:FecR family protein [Pedobacter gandavensis]|uniref:FecR family protein n=1 Tax=Pedobacter gandavensis TaxID=2679963 RepID=UPI002931BE86|nr:FecR domain-containing protein [Pedobacter gandavensis]